MNAPAKTPVRGYKFIVMGEYIARGDHGKVIRFYKKEVFYTPEIVTYRLGNKWEKYKDKDGAKKKRSVPDVMTQNMMRCYKHFLRKYYVAPLLREKYEDFIRVRTVNVLRKERVEEMPADVNFRDINELKVEDMSEGELLQFIAIKDLKVNIGSYSDLADKRMATEMSLETAMDAEVMNAQKAESHNSDMYEPDGVMVSSGKPMEDGVLTDEEQLIDKYV